MTVTHLTPADYLTTQWSGGTTTQLAIAPKGAVYAERDFLWRISSAAVELEESDFTPLPDYHRIISTLRGDMVLTHNGGEALTLHPYEIHEFEGSDDTHSRGKCRDFNLMLRKGRADGSVCAVTLNGEDCHAQAPRGENSVLLLFCASGEVTVRCGESSYRLREQEALLLEDCSGENCTLSGERQAVLMLTAVWRC